ncbi:hypothetical protein [Gulbenkiania mobilis]|uniref:Uncharacterized protein n=1 Tax=Gulbenkiania mobilis TaxID=397457 RepID=A0ABY2CVY8_GULMO|nr:hypothetical protein EV669_105132 [Gulbenkiania mobilis]
MTEYQIADGIPITWLLSVSGIVLGGVFGLLKWFAGRMIDEIETRLKRIDDLEGRFERLMAELPLHYQRREDAIREYTTINAKIDRLTEVLIDIRGVMNAKQN